MDRSQIFDKVEWSNQLAYLDERMTTVFAIECPGGTKYRRQITSPRGIDVKPVLLT